MPQPFKQPALNLIETAERVIAERGPGVPLREIVQSSGGANKVAVQYHFGDRQGLIDSVFQYRLPQLEVRRAELFEKLVEGGLSMDTPALIDALLRPIGEVFDKDGRRSFAGFLFQMTAHARYARPAFDALSPNATLILTKLRHANAAMPTVSYDRRLGAASLLFLDIIRPADEGLAPNLPDIDEALTLAAAVMAA